MAKDNNGSIDNNKNVNRWWEFYFVRYFVGTSVGAIVTFFILISNDTNLAHPEVHKVLEFLKQSDSSYYWVLAFVGLAFCYIASAPILVLHATRGSFLKVRKAFNYCQMSIWAVLILLFTFMQAYLLSSSLDCGNKCFSKDFFVEGLIIFFIVSVIVIGQFFLLWLSLYGKENDAVEYYDVLVKKRANVDKTGEEYVESYRHLREHGNAFFIVLLEITLGAFLYYSPMPWLYLLMIWIFPSAGVWFFGTMLENREFPTSK